MDNKIIYDESNAMWKLTEAADWLDGQSKQSTNVLDQMVEDSGYRTDVMIMASTTQAFMQFGTSMADVLRLGDGVAQVSLRGIAIDTARFVAIFPFGKAAKFLQPTVGTLRARVIADPLRTEGICAWVATTKALTQTGHKIGGVMFTEVEQLMKAAGFKGLESFVKYEGIAIDTMVNHLKLIGAKVGPIIEVRGMRDVLGKQILKADGSVLLISLRGSLKTGEQVGHLVYAYFDIFRRLRFMDRTIGKGQAGGRKFYSSIEEITARYSSVKSFDARRVVRVDNVFVKPNTHGVPQLVMPIKGVVAEYLD